MTEEEKKDFEKKDAEMCLRQEELRALYGTRLFMLKTEWGYLGGSACINDCFTAPCGCDPESNTVTPHCDESGAVTWPALFASRAIAEEAAADYAMVYQEIRRRDDQNQRLFPCGPGAFFCMSSSDTFWFRFRTHL